MSEFDETVNGDTGVVAVSGVRPVIADALTLLRALLTVAIMVVIIVGWRGLGEGNAATYETMLSASILASVLFGVAALTDVLDDVMGGAEMAGLRRWGWFDDVADTILVDGTLIALVVATMAAGTLGLGLVIPVVVIVARDALVALAKGYELTRLGWPQTAWGTGKNALAMVSTLALVAAPWLTVVIDGLRANADNVMEVFGEPSAFVWNAGLIGLWVTAVLAVVTGVILLRKKA